MGIFSRAQAVAAYQPAAIAQVPAGVFGTSYALPLALFPEVDTSQLPVTAEQAWSVPGVARALQLYSSITSRLPLRGAPFITAKSGGATTPGLTISWMVQDLILVGASLLQVERDGDYVSAAARVHPARWAVTTEGHVTIDGKVVPDNSVVYVSSLVPGFLTSGRDSVRHALSLARTVNNRSATPAPAMVVQPTSDFSGTPEDIQEAMDNVADVFANARGGLVYLPRDLTLSAFGASDAQLLIEARDAVRTDLANHLGISAAMLDGTRSGSNEIYSNSLQQTSELLELSIKTFAEPLADRLSQDDVTPPGTRVSFDYTAFDIASTDAAGNVGAPRPANLLNGDNA